MAALAATPSRARATEDAVPTDATRLRWSPSLIWFILPGQRDLLQAVLPVDRGPIHLELRYNYEARETGSAWVGWNFKVGEELVLVATPMVGGVFGATNGVAPGLTFSVSYGPVVLWSQSEYVIDFDRGGSSFFYAWTELSATNGDWLRIGVALQRTRAFQTTTAVQWAPLVGVAFWKLSASAYLFSPAAVNQYAVVTLAAAL